MVEVGFVYIVHIFDSSSVWGACKSHHHLLRHPMNHINSNGDASGIAKGSFQAPSPFSPANSAERVGLATSYENITQASRLPLIPGFNPRSQELLLEEIRLVDVIPVVPLLSSVLRPISSPELLNVKEKLIQDGLIQEGFGWKCQSKPPAGGPSDSPNLTTFKLLERIYTAIIDAAIMCQVLPTQESLLAPLSIDEVGRSKSEPWDISRPDGYLYLKESSLGSRSEKILDYADVVFFMGLKHTNEITDRKSVSLSRCPKAKCLRIHTIEY
jgi:hypothetical protein